jgi:HSP20 family protein
MNRLFNDMFDGWGLRPFSEMEERLAAYQPSIDVSETAKAIKVTAELPGMEEKDVSVTLDEDALTISGEKKEETKEEDEKSYARETTYGSFQRVIPLTSKVDMDNVSASFKRGVLKVNLPKVPGEEPTKGKKIEIATE